MIVLRVKTQMAFKDLALEEDLTPSGKELMCILRVLVCKSQVYLKRKPALEDDSSKKRQKTFTPEQCSNRENLYTETKYCNTFERYDNVHEKLTNNQDYFLTSLGLQTGCVNETNKNITTWKLAKFKVTPSIPFSSNLGQILMKRDNHHFPDNLKRHRIERVERYINQPCRKSFNVKYDVTYPEKKSKELTFHWYKFPSKKTRQQCISKRDNVAIRCKQLSIKLVRENLNVLREKLKVEQKDSFNANEFKGGMLERESILNILLNCASLANLIGNSHVHLEEGYTKSVILLYIHLNYSVFYPVVVFAEMGWFQGIIMVSLYSLKCSVDVLFKSVEKVNQLIKTIENDDILTLNNRIPNHPSVYNEYQRIVNTKLVNIYKYHVNILRVTQLYSKSTRIRICGGILQAIGLNYLLFALLSLDNLNLIGKLLALASSLTGYLLGIAGLSIIGQMCEDELTKLYWTLYKMSWYKWDIENKQIYRMLILRARHIDSIRFGLNSTANKSSLLKYLKTTYAFFAFFYQTSLVS
ncbi:hypothetical protein GWI33_004867 [Rhynchophorus ferrugineus]|uniref:Odorant receptor n=1 Tax=Rhynchophorus ferrugineus TaxID=354439 RepID=A0A834IKC1_RHYFE|nr:hypothetical protein GWI33_004867 [Rhynchophorus ferrugineus]